MTGRLENRVAIITGFLGELLWLTAKFEARKENDLCFNVNAINQHNQEILKGRVVYSLY